MSRIDAHLLPFIIILYLLAFLDRVNIANARSFSLERDLGMDVGGTQYNSGKSAAIMDFFFSPFCRFPMWLLLTLGSRRL